MGFISDERHKTKKNELLDSYVKQLQLFYQDESEEKSTGDEVMDALSGFLINENQKKVYDFFGLCPPSVFDDFVRVYIPSLDKKKSELSEKLDFIRLKHIYDNFVQNVSQLNSSSNPFKMKMGLFFDRRQIYNENVYTGFSHYMKDYFYKAYIKTNKYNEEFEVENVENNGNLGMLSVSFALTCVNIYFELIYSDIDDYFKFCNFENMSSDELEKNVRSFSNFLLDKYGGNNDYVRSNISEVLVKYFTDNNMIKLPTNGLPRTIMKNLRKYFPKGEHHNFKSFRNLSHGDFEIYEDDGKYVILKDNGQRFSSDDLFDLVSQFSFDADAKAGMSFEKYLVNSRFSKEDGEFLQFLSSNIDPNRKLNSCGFDDKRVLQMLLSASYYSIFQYNLQHYFKYIERFKSDKFDCLSFNSLFDFDQDGGRVFKFKEGDLFSESLLYNKYEYLKNALGHGNFRISEKCLCAYNPKSLVSISGSFLDSLEFFSQPSFCTLVVYPKPFHDLISSLIKSGRNIYEDDSLAISKYNVECLNAVNEAVYTEKTNARPKENDGAYTIR